MIILNDIKGGYDGKVEIDHVCLSLPDNALVGITGPNGGGKTTLLRIILRLLKPIAGSVTFLRHGKPADTLSMGYLPQYAGIDYDFPISVEEVVTSGLDCLRGLTGKLTADHRLMVSRAMSLTGISQLSCRHIKALSGGQRQRVMLARAIVANPEVLVLDEPDTYIDASFAPLLYDIVTRMSRHCSVIIASHDDKFLRDNASMIVYVEETTRVLR